MEEINSKIKEACNDGQGNRILESLEFYKEFIELVNFAFLVINPDNKIAYCNSTAANLFGIDNGELKSLTIFDLFSQIRSYTFEEESLVQNYNDGKSINNEVVQIKRKNNSQIWMNLCLKPILNENEQITCTILTGLDISGMKDYENQLNQIMNFEKLITSISSQFLGTLDFNKAIKDTLKRIGISKMVSRVYLFSFDESNEYLINTHEWCAEGIETHIDFFRKTPLNKFPSVKENILSGKFVSIENSLDFSKGSSNLRKILSSRCVRATLAYPIYTNGIISGILGFDDEKKPRVWAPEDYSLIKVVSQIIGNALERKIDEDKIQESEEKYRNILESIKEGYFEVDLYGNFTFFNDALCEITGYSRENLLNLNYSELYDDDTRQYLYEEFNKLLKIKNVFKMLEYPQKKKNGELIYLESSAYLKYDVNAITGFKGFVRDVSERKKGEFLRRSFNQKLEEKVLIRTNQLTEALDKQKLYLDQIIKSSYFKTEFLATMSHELRTPLNSIIGFTDLLLEGIYGNLNPEQLEFIKDIKSSAEHQFDMISQILDISKIESGQISLKFEDIHLLDFMNNILSTLRSLINEKKLVLEMKGIKKKHLIKADPHKLKHIIENLLNNAIKFTEKGYIIIEFSYYKNGWELLIKDSGIGIAEENFRLIFKDFKRVKSPFVDSTPGSGLGLALTKRIIELHGGRISFSSKLGEGTTFRIRIPNEPKKNDTFVIEQFLGKL